MTERTFLTHAGVWPLGVRQGCPDELNRCKSTKPPPQIRSMHLTLVTSIPFAKAIRQTAEPAHLVRGDAQATTGTLGADVVAGSMSAID